MKQTRKDSDTGEYRQIETSPVGFARYLIFRNATDEQIGMTTRIVWRAIVLYTIAVFWGWTAYAGKEPPYFALADGRNVAQQVKDLRLAALEDSLIETLRVKCTAPNKGYADRRLRELKEQYRVLAGAKWDEPGCDEI